MTMYITTNEKRERKSVSSECKDENFRLFLISITTRLGVCAVVFVYLISLEDKTIRE